MTKIKIYNFKELDFKFAEFLLHKIGWFMVFNATFNNISVHKYHGGQFYWWRKSETRRKPADISQVSDKFYHIIHVVSGTPRHECLYKV